MSPKELREAWSGIENGLQTCDILMFHKRGSWLSRKIRKAAGSYWNHTALVFMPKQDLPVGGPLIVKASFVGIEIHQMKRYADAFDDYDIGVMRYPGLTEEQKERITMDFILANLDVTYDYSRLAGFIIGPIVKRISPKLWAKGFRKLTHHQRFVCTTFVHKAFHDLSAHREVSGHVETRDHLVEKLQQEEFISPGDIAREPIFEWVFNKHL